MNFLANKKIAKIYRKTIDLSYFYCYSILIFLRRISVAVRNKKTPIKIGSMVFSSLAVGSVVFQPKLLRLLVSIAVSCRDNHSWIIGIRVVIFSKLGL